MRRPAPLAALIMSVGIVLAAPASAGEDVLTFAHIQRSFPTFHGTIDSRDHRCVKGRTVKLMEKRKHGEDRVLGRDRARANGHWKVKIAAELGRLLREGAEARERAAGPGVLGGDLPGADRRLSPAQASPKTRRASWRPSTRRSTSSVRRVDAEARAGRRGRPRGAPSAAARSGGRRAPPPHGGRGSPRRRGRGRPRARTRPARGGRPTAVARRCAAPGPRPSGRCAWAVTSRSCAVTASIPRPSSQRSAAAMPIAWAIAGVPASKRAGGSA